ncbi:hypothetical protein BDQ94DRAFT_132450 [Aspergillus welwitschiae]|uniref:Uncharacterized protein n=1 Tax=Aspergillus welwitschiae TaxID=1341132 RepID=A0A3F3QIY1_9EURO|nr:hypothetical protein BDQ94DRAFT_132450 [Aspergillus welwitschiae]RDH39131.1 hypothetical protein BDQ94DRAFT_132450 [Aspergillus welwitschiae]
MIQQHNLSSYFGSRRRKTLVMCETKRPTDYEEGFRRRGQSRWITSCTTTSLRRGA